MKAGALHVHADLLETLRRQDIGSGQLLRLLLHLKQLCPDCAQEIDRFAHPETQPEGCLHGATGLWPLPVAPSTEAEKREAAAAAQGLAALSAGDRARALATGAVAATPALFHAWMRCTETALGDDSGEGEARTRFALALAQQLDPDAVPTLLWIDHQIEAWAALAQDALGRGRTQRAVLALRVAYLLLEGGSGDPQQAAWLQALHGLLDCQRSDPESGALRLAEAAQLAREIEEPHLMGGILLLQGLVLAQLGHHSAAASTLRDGLAHVDRKRSGDLAGSAEEVLELVDAEEMRGGGEEEPS